MLEASPQAAAGIRSCFHKRIVDEYLPSENNREWGPSKSNTSMAANARLERANHLGGDQFCSSAASAIIEPHACEHHGTGTACAIDRHSQALVATDVTLFIPSALRISNTITSSVEHPSPLSQHNTFCMRYKLAISFRRYLNEPLTSVGADGFANAEGCLAQRVSVRLARQLFIICYLTVAGYASKLLISSLIPPAIDRFYAAIAAHFLFFLRKLSLSAHSSVVRRAKFQCHDGV